MKFHLPYSILFAWLLCSLHISQVRSQNESTTAATDTASTADPSSSDSATAGSTDPPSAATDSTATDQVTTTSPPGASETSAPTTTTTVPTTVPSVPTTETSVSTTAPSVPATEISVPTTSVINETPVPTNATQTDPPTNNPATTSPATPEAASTSPDNSTTESSTTSSVPGETSPDSGSLDNGTSSSPDVNSTAPSPTVTDEADNTTTEAGSTAGANETDSTTGASSASSAGSTAAPDTSSPSSENSTDTTGATDDTGTSSTASVTTPKPAVTTPSSTLTTKYPTGPQFTEIARYSLSLEITEAECNDSALHTELDHLIGRSGVPGYVDTQSRGENRFSVSFLAKPLVGRDSAETILQLDAALNTWSVCYNYTDNINQSIASFAALTGSYCSAEFICSPGYKCRGTVDPVCTSACEDIVCQNSGVCQLVYTANGRNATAQCSCQDTNDSIYSGRFCEKSNMNPERVAAIVGGVLGAVCFILLVALYCMCYRKREAKGKKYQLSGVYNDTYDHGSLDMKNM